MNSFQSRTKTIISKLALLSVLTIASLYPLATSVHANASLAGGDFMQAFNNTTPQGTWTDPINAKPGEVVEFRITAKNNGDQPAENVQIWGSTTSQIPQDPTTKFVITGRINSASIASDGLTDTATVNVVDGGPIGFRYVTGHARLNGVTDKYNCPNTCDIGDNVLEGIDVGTIQPGDFVEVSFKASLNGTPAVTPTPTPVPACVSNDSCSVSTPSACGQTNTGVDNCGKACSRSSDACAQGQTQTQSQSQTVNITNPTPTAAPTTPVVTTLPKTGLPAIAWLISALIPTGFGLRRFKGIEKELEDDPNYIWEDRKFKSH